MEVGWEETFEGSHALLKQSVCNMSETLTWAAIELQQIDAQDLLF